MQQWQLQRYWQNGVRVSSAQPFLKNSGSKNTVMCSVQSGDEKEGGSRVDVWLKCLRQLLTIIQLSKRCWSNKKKDGCRLHFEDIILKPNFKMCKMDTIENWTKWQSREEWGCTYQTRSSLQLLFTDRDPFLLHMHAHTHTTPSYTPPNDDPVQIHLLLPPPTN